MPRLENWIYSNGHLIGDIYDDNRFPDGTEVRTSTVHRISDTEAQTRNTLYTLGLHRSEYTKVEERLKAGL